MFRERLNNRWLRDLTINCVVSACRRAAALLLTKPSLTIAQALGIHWSLATKYKTDAGHGFRLRRKVGRRSKVTGLDGSLHQKSRGWLLVTAAARRIIISRPGAHLIHDPPYRPRATSAFGAAPKTAIDFAGAADRALGCNGSHLMIRNHVTGTDDHRVIPRRRSATFYGGIILRSQRPQFRETTYPCHGAAGPGKHDDMKSF